MGGVVRGCGTRVAGGIYMVVPTSKNGRPIEDFLLDPPLPIDTEAVGLGRRGVVPIERDGITHVLDWVGSTDYPNVADFVEEARRFGISRRVPRTFDFSLLTPESRLILVHERAAVANPGMFRRWMVEGWAESAKMGTPCPVCAKGFESHESLTIVTHEADGTPRFDTTNPEMCAGIWWHDVAGGEEVESIDPREVVRTMPSFRYRARKRPEGCVPSYVVAAFATFPIGSLAVINDPAGGSHVEAVEKAQAARLPVHVEDD